MQFGAKITIIALAFGLMGCMQAPDFMSKSKDTPETEEVTRASSNFTQPEDAPKSEIMETLLNRNSLLPAGTPYAEVADAGS